LMACWSTSSVIKLTQIIVYLPRSVERRFSLKISLSQFHFILTFYFAKPNTKLKATDELCRTGKGIKIYRSRMVLTHSTYKSKKFE
jgi:hypothetical protein